jgi:hypothetical protein
MTTSTAFNSTSFAGLILRLKDSADRVLKRIELLEHSENSYGIAVIGYPNDALEENLKKVCRMIEDIKELKNFTIKRVPAKHGRDFILVKGILTTEDPTFNEVTDLGQFTLGLIEKDEIVLKQRCTLYSVKDTF